MTHWIDSWKKLKPLSCDEALEWAQTQPDWQTAWEKCQRGDWMAFRLGRNLKQGSPEHRRFILATIECGRLSLPYAGKYQKTLAQIYADLESWANGDSIDLQTVFNAASAAAWGAVLKQCADIYRQYFPVAP